MVTNFFSVDFWEYRFFSHLYTYFELKNIRSSKNFCLKNDSQFDRKKELEAMRAGRG